MTVKPHPSGGFSWTCEKCNTHGRTLYRNKGLAARAYSNHLSSTNHRGK